MTAESPAALIRRASERLREDVPPGDLATCECGEHIDVHTDDGCLRCACIRTRQGVVAQAVAKHSVDRTVVADLLDGIAKWRLPCEPPCWERGVSGCPDCETVGPALRVARSILRETGEDQ